MMFIAVFSGRKRKKKNFQKNFHTLPFFPWEFIDYYLSFKYCFLKNWTNKLKKNNSVLTMMAIYDCWHCSWKYRENRISTTHIVLLMLEKKNLKCSFSEIEKKNQWWLKNTHSKPKSEEKWNLGICSKLQRLKKSTFFEIYSNGLPFFSKRRSFKKNVDS